MTTKPTRSKDSKIADVLTQNVEATEQIAAAAAELVVVHAVLTSHGPAKGAKGDLEAAVERTGEIEEQLTETAEALDKSNKLLREIGAEQRGKASGRK